MESDQAYSAPLVADRVALLEAARGALRGPPARTGLERLLVLRLRRAGDGGGARVQAQAGDHRVGVTVVGVDRDPLADALLAPAHEAAAVQRRGEQPAGVQRVGDGAAAVIALGLEGAMAAAVDVRLVLDLVGGEDRLLDLERRAGGRGRRPVGEQP